MLNPDRSLAALLMTFTVLPVIACTLIARQLDASSTSPLATPVVRADEISEASADERIPTKIRQWLAGQSASSPADLADALAALSESDGELRYVKALPVEGSQQAGVPAIIAWWGESDYKPKGGLLTWLEPGTHIAYPDWSRQLDGPIAVDFRGQRITFYFVKSDGQYLLQAIDSRPVPTPTP